MTFNSDQLGMAIFLLVAAVFNLWFVVTSSIRAAGRGRPFPEKDTKVDAGQEESTTSSRTKLLNYSVLAMALFDILWVWCCMVQCWYNTFHDASTSDFNQNAGPDSIGCKFMGWYSSFSLVSMMGSHCLVVYHLKNVLTEHDSTVKRFLVMALSILIFACLFASMPLLLLGGQDGGYLLTNGGFCYANFTNTVQSSIMLAVVLLFLMLATTLWCGVPHRAQYWAFYVVFFVTWTLWVPATSYGIATGEEIAPPYMIIGAIVGHANALVNPILYGASLFHILGRADGGGKTNESAALIHYGGVDKTDQDMVEVPQVSISVDA